MRRRRKNADSLPPHTEVAAAYCRAEGGLGVGQFTLTTAWRKSSLLAPGSKPRQTAACFSHRRKKIASKLFIPQFVRETATCNAAV